MWFEWMIQYFRCEREETAGPSTALRSGRDDTFVESAGVDPTSLSQNISMGKPLNCRSLHCASLRSGDKGEGGASIRGRIVDGKTADPSASLGMTRGKAVLLFEIYLSR